MIVKENKTLTSLSVLNISDTFMYSDSYFMLAHYGGIDVDSGYTLCVDLETGMITQLRLSTTVERIECECHVKGVE